MRRHLCWRVLLLLALSVACVACKGNERRQTGTAGAGGSNSSIGGVTGSEADLLIEALESADRPDEQSFALYFISHFELNNYREAVTKLANGNSVLPAVVLSAVYDDIGPLEELLTAVPGAQAFNDVTGAVYGLRSAAQMPPQAWDAILAAPGSEATTDQLWSLAVLDAEPGGPLTQSASLRSHLHEWHAKALATGDTMRLAALDALLGTTDGRRIDWALFGSQAAELTLQNSQWIALMRHAEPAQWSAMLATRQAASGPLAPLFEAAAAVAPAGFLPSQEREAYASMGVELEYDALAFAADKTETINLPELARLLDLFVVAEGQFSPVGSEADFARLLRFARYAATRNDRQSLDLLVSRIMSIGEDHASGILATIERYGAAALSDADLRSLCDSRERTIGYWLLFGWPDRKPVQESTIVRLVWLSPNREDRMLFQAYSRWLEQEGIIKPPAPDA